jgi:hypothetical protein
MGVEPMSVVWKTTVSPLNYCCIFRGYNPFPPELFVGGVCIPDFRGEKLGGVCIPDKNRAKTETNFQPDYTNQPVT